MPRVDKDAQVTLVVLVYRSLRWLSWCQEGVDSSKQDTRYRWLAVSNDASEEIERDPRILLCWRNEDPNEYFINRVYRAWNAGVIEATTQKVICLNSDMFCSDHAIDELMVQHKEKTLPCGLLIENGRVQSGMPEHVSNFGTSPDDFQASAFLQRAGGIRCPGLTEPGRLFMPALFDRQEFIDMGGYPEGNVGDVSGDRILFEKYVAEGFKWVTCLGSVWYHCQRGEQLWP